MSMIYIDMREIRNANYNVLPISSEVNHAQKKLRTLRWNIEEEIAAHKRIGQRLAGLCNEMGLLERWINELYEITNLCVMQYETAERENFHNAELFQ